jgi:hypothetical protein
MMNGRKEFEKPFIIRKSLVNPRLLKNHLRKPDPVRVFGLPEGEVALVFLIP